MRRIFTFFLTFLLGVFVTALYAQTHTVSGTVIDKDANEPLIGANVLIKGTTIGTVTDLDGKYTLQASDKDILVFSYLSMKTIEEPVNGRTVINVKMASDTETLGEVVVTAMGIKRQSETLTYSAQTVGGKDVNDIKSVNMINSLQGKSAGMMIDTKLGLGLVAAGLYRTDRNDMLLPPSNVSLFGDVSTVGFYMLGIRGTHIFPQDKYRLDYTLYFYSFPSKFWGIGYDMGKVDANESDLDRWQAQVKASFLFRIADNLYVGPMASYDYVHGKNMERPELLEGMNLTTAN